MNEAQKSVTIQFRIGPETVSISVPTPPDVARLDSLLPIVRSIVDAAIEYSVGESDGRGKVISCHKGCAACCRAQPVPVTPIEAYALSLLVSSLDEPRQNEIRARFADRVHQLTQAGLIDAYFTRRSDLTREEAISISKRYFNLHLACPFLEGDACGIYEERPFVCRQYLVTSPVQRCENPFHNDVELVPMMLSPASATLAFLQDVYGSPQYTIPLVLALTFVEENREILEQTFESEPMARLWIEKLFQPELPE